MMDITIETTSAMASVSAVTKSDAISVFCSPRAGSEKTIGQKVLVLTEKQIQRVGWVFLFVVYFFVT